MMRTLRYVVTIDESFAERDYGRTKRFLCDVVSIVPAAGVGCVVRRTSPLPLVPATAGGMLMSPAGPRVVTKYSQLNCTVDITKNATQEGTTWREECGMKITSDDMWDRFCRLLNCLLLDRSGEVCDWDGMTNEIRAYDVIVYVRPALTKSAAPIEKNLFIRQLARSMDLPIWLCPPYYDGIYRVVIAATGRPGEDRLLAAGQIVAHALGVPIAVVCSGNPAFCNACIHQANSNASCARWPIRTCRRVEEIPACLELDELLVIGAYGRSPFTRFFCTSNTEKILGGLRNPALILPHRIGFFGDRV